MPEKIKINFNGKEADAIPIDVNQSDEHWNDYLLDDGSKVRMKLTLLKAIKVENEFDRDGNPVYLMQSTNVTTVDAPKDLKRKS